MDDEQILARGGDQHDIEEHAKQHGADLTLVDVLVEEFKDKFVGNTELGLVPARNISAYEPWLHTALTRVATDARGQAERINPVVRVQAIMAKMDLLKLKADDYNWQCHTPDSVKAEIAKALADIDALLATASVSLQ